MYNFLKKSYEIYESYEMFAYKNLLAILHLFMGTICYQTQTNPDQSGLIVPNLWPVQNYGKNWAEISRPISVGTSSNTNPNTNSNNLIEVPNNIIDFGVDEQQQQQQQQQQSARYLEKRQEQSLQNSQPSMAAAAAAAAVAAAAAAAAANGNGNDGIPSYADNDASTVSAMQYELQTLVQIKYQAEAAIKMETGEIARTQHEAQEAERALEEATNNVRIISAHLKGAQEEASKAATRALTAQLQMSVHDQLLVTARQKLNSVTAHMIALQADLANAQQRFMLSNSTKELENRAHALRLRPEQGLFNLQGAAGNGEPMFTNGDATNGYQQQPQHSGGGGAASSALLSVGDFWRQPFEPNGLSVGQSPQQANPMLTAGSWPFSQLISSPAEAQKQSNPALFMASKKI